MKPHYSMIMAVALTASLPTFAEHGASAEAAAKANVEAETGFFGQTWANVKGMLGADEETGHNEASKQDQPENEKAYSQGQKERADAAREQAKAHGEHAREMTKHHQRQAHEQAKNARESLKENNQKMRESLKEHSQHDIKAGVRADVDVQAGAH